MSRRKTFRSDKVSIHKSLLKYYSPLIQLSFTQSKWQPSKIFPTFIFFLSAVEPTNGETKWRNRNNLQIDSVHASGDCCWDIEDNDYDYETVDPGNPSLTNFDIATVKVYNSCN